MLAVFTFRRLIIMNETLISVIVPVYNVEAYLDKCMESIVNQTYKNIEIVLVDDGSPDNCPSMCDKWAEKDSRIKVIHKQNGGLSDARNAGISYSHGDYITFVDSDDYLAEDCIAVLYDVLRSNNAEMSVASFEYVYHDAVKKRNFTANTEIYTPQQYMLSYYANVANDAMFEKAVSFVISCCKLYKKSLFNEIKFPVGRYHEDEFTTYKLCFCCERIAYIDKSLYFYVQQEGSITNTFSEKRIEDALDAFEERLDFFSKGKDCEELYAVAALDLVRVYKDDYIAAAQQGNKQFIKKTRCNFKRHYARIKKEGIIKQCPLNLRFICTLLYFCPALYNGMRRLLR